MSTLRAKANTNLGNPDLFERMVLATPEEIIALYDEIHELRTTLAEALDWIDRPVAIQEDAVYFQEFEKRAAELIQ